MPHLAANEHGDSADVTPARSHMQQAAAHAVTLADVATGLQKRVEKSDALGHTHLFCLKEIYGA